LKLDIEIINEQTQYTINEQMVNQIHKALDKAAELHELSGGEVVISFVDDGTIQHLNKEYRNIDRPTDVLSFAMNEQGENEMEIVHDEEEGQEVPQMLGDIVISVPRVLDQAEEFGHSIEREICFLAVHGFLHLIGYDHGSEEEEKEMFSLQENILEQVGITRS
jgi:probable rRNA maturation factor